MYIHVFLLYLHQMRIEEAIQQKKFQHEYEKLAVNLAYTESYLNNKFMTLLKPHGLTQPQFNVLRILLSGSQWASLTAGCTWGIWTSV